MNESQQYLREWRLIVANQNLGLDLSDLRIKFSVKRSDTVTPNTAEIRIFNLNEVTAQRLQKEFTRVILQAGYPGNVGVIFQGNIKQVLIGRESQTDTYVDVLAGDGDRAYNFAIVNASIAKGSTQADQLKTAVDAMAAKGVTRGSIEGLSPTKFPRGKALFGEARRYITSIADTNRAGWSIQDEQINLIPKTTYLPGERVIINAATGMIGTPQQTNEGVNVKTLLNPSFRIGGRVQLDNKSIERFRIDLTRPATAGGVPAPLTADGVYYLLVVEHQGDTRGTEWYSTLVCLNVDVSSNPLNSVQTGYGA